MLVKKIKQPVEAVLELQMQAGNNHFPRNHICKSWGALLLLDVTKSMEEIEREVNRCKKVIWKDNCDAMFKIYCIGVTPDEREERQMDDNTLRL